MESLFLGDPKQAFFASVVFTDFFPDMLVQ